METQTSLGIVILGRPSRFFLEWGQGSGVPGAAGPQHRLGGHSPGTWGTTDKIDNNIQHDLSSISHYLTEKIPLSLSALFLTLVANLQGLES